MTDRADTVLTELVRPGLRRAVARGPLSTRRATPEQAANLDAKERFAARCREVLGDDQSVRDLALFFGVKRTHLHERMRMKRTDVAPLAEWFQKLDDYAEFTRLYALFARTA